MWITSVYVVTALWAGYMLGQLSAHFWYYEHYRGILKRRIYGPHENYEKTQEKLAEQAENRLAMLERQTPETNVKLFSAALVAGFVYFFRKYLPDW